MRTPLLFIIFNRPDTTERVFTAIRNARPEKLFIAADGPRMDKQGEADKCKACIDIVSRIDWPCEVKTDYSSINLGCRERVSSALDWFFKAVPEGIILEDDCLPVPAFFTFMETMLSKYREEEKIMHISGNNFLFGTLPVKEDYYFSRIPHIWGWASWRRAWKKYDVGMRDLPEFENRKDIRDVFPEKFVQKSWIEIFRDVYHKRIDTWDYQWTYAVFKNQGLCINPANNLISNIGFGNDATHTGKISRFADMPAIEMKLNGISPKELKPNQAADQYILRNNFSMSWWNGIKKRIRKLIYRG